MIARLWWKETRQLGPIWAVLAGLGVFWIVGARWCVGARVTPDALGVAAILLTCVYMFLTGAAAFAGERENRTLSLLDALPVERWRVWVAKASFAAVTTAALLLLLEPLALLLADSSRVARPGEFAGLGFMMLWGLAWSLLFSALLGNALLAAVLAMASLVPFHGSWSWSGFNGMGLPEARDPSIGHWLFLVAVIAASALVLHLGGPPRMAWFGSRRRPRRESIKAMDKHISLHKIFDVWPGLTSRLVWQSLREVWPIWWALAMLGIALPVLWTLSASSADPMIWLASSLVISLVAGVNVFNAENRRGTQRFLANHGARPGRVWLVKLAVGLATVAPIWFCVDLLSSTPWSLRLTGLIPPRWAGVIFGEPVFAALFLGSFVLSAFAVGAWCGMVFRRGITAGMVSLVLWLLVFLPPLFLAAVGLVWPWHLPWIPVAVLAVTWAWSGDWLLDRPGVGRWARLGLYSTAAAVALTSAYVANRVWAVPAFPLAQQERILQLDRIAAEVPAGENAADLYREVSPNLHRQVMAHAEVPDRRSIFVDRWDTSDSEVLDWLNVRKPILEKLRKAAALPVCRFRDLGRQTIFIWSNADPDPYLMARPLVLSARVRLAEGDLKGAWEDIEALLRMGRQFTGLNLGWTRQQGDEVENGALSLAMLWAVDFGQTPELLEQARDAYRSIPPAPSLADQLRASALIINNTLNMPRRDLVHDLMRRRGREAGLFDQLMIDAMTTPWELARARRVCNLLAAARVQAVEEDPAGMTFVPFSALQPNALTVGEGRDAITIPRVELLRLAITTPQLDMVDFDGALDQARENIAPRRALDVVFSLLAWQARRGGKLPETLDELAADDPGVAPSLIDPYSRPLARFGYIPSRGQKLRPLGSFVPPEGPSNRLSNMERTYPTRDHMLLYSVGPDGNDGRAAVDRDRRDQGDIIFPLKNNLQPAK